MTKILYILITLFILTSCGENKPTSIENNNLIYKDTTIIFKANNQNISLAFDSIGNIQYLKAKVDTGVQNIFFYQNGLVQQIQNCRRGEIENLLDFYDNGQVDRIEWEDMSNSKVNSQHLKFSKSKSKSILIDHYNSFAPIVIGMQEYFYINKDNELTFKDISHFPSKYEIENLDYDTTNLEIHISKNDKSQISIKSKRPGTYRLIAKVKSTFFFNTVKFTSDLQGTWFMVDVDLTFK